MIRFKDYITEVHATRNISKKLVDHLMVKILRAKPKNKSSLFSVLDAAFYEYAKKNVAPLLGQIEGFGVVFTARVSLAKLLGEGMIDYRFENHDGEKVLHFDMTLFCGVGDLDELLTLLFLEDKYGYNAVRRRLDAMAEVFQHEYTHMSQYIKLLEKGDSADEFEKKMDRQVKAMRSSYGNKRDDYMSTPEELDAFSNGAATRLIAIAKGDIDKAIELYQTGRLEPLKRLKDTTLYHYDRFYKSGQITKTTYDEFMRYLGKNLYKRKRLSA
jgi:hypothetical protein